MQNFVLPDSTFAATSQILRTIEGSWLIRSWAFRENGRQIAIYTGALHFAGAYLLYDIATGQLIDSFEDPLTEESPAWARDLVINFSQSDSVN